MNPSEEWHLNTAHLGKRVIVFQRLESTNSLALRLAEDHTNDGLAILANEQTGGRGQHGRTWSCPVGAGVLLSVILFPPPDLRRPAVLTAWAAVAVCELIQKIARIEAQIKWPNDVLIGGRKVCGILIEQGQGTVAGIGLNVNQPKEHFAAAGLEHATSLAAFTQRQWACEAVAKQLIEELDAEYDQLLRGDVVGLETRWAGLLGLNGKEAEVESTAGIQRGRLLSITFAGLQLRLGDGDSIQFPPEAVRHVRPKPG